MFLVVAGVTAIEPRRGRAVQAGSASRSGYTQSDWCTNARYCGHCDSADEPPFVGARKPTSFEPVVGTEAVFHPRRADAENLRCYVIGGIGCETGDGGGGAGPGRTG